MELFGRPGHKPVQVCGVGSIATGDPPNRGIDHDTSCQDSGLGHETSLVPSSQGSVVGVAVVVARLGTQFTGDCPTLE